MKKIVLTDLHLSPKSEDAYRWSIFEWIKNQSGIFSLIILGDICEEKDEHDSVFVNTVVNKFIAVVNNTSIESIIILCGNHDYVDSNNPYFLFLNKLDNCNINFIKEPTKIGEDLYIPYQYNDFEEISKKYSFCDNLFLHHSFNGIQKREGFYETKGCDINNLSHIKFNNCYSGHIHLAQTYKNIEFIGAPYAVKFGDSNNGRALLINNNKKEYINLPRFINKIDIKLTALDEIQKYEILEKDQVKVEINLTLENCYDYENMKQCIKKYIEERGAYINSIEGKLIHNVSVTDKKTEVILDNNQIIKKFCQNKNLPNTYFFTANQLLKEFNEA